MAIPSSIRDFLERQPIQYAVLEHPLAYTAREEAGLADVPDREWAKTVVCVADGQTVIAVVPADHLVDLHRLQAVLGAQSIRLATEAEMAEMYKDCALGAMPPLGPLYSQPVIVDTRLREDEAIAFNAGTHRDAIQMRYPDFETLVHPKVEDIGVRRPDRH